jgi:hypothetical protein
VSFTMALGATPAEWLANETMRLSRAAYTDLQSQDQMALEKREDLDLIFKMAMEKEEEHQPAS